MPKSSVLIVDRSAESREVLRTALERRGMTVFEAADAADGQRLARQHHLDLIVLDLEAADPQTAIAGESAPGTLAGGDRAPTPMVLLGMARRGATLPPERAGQFIAKPYHYRPLILKIEQMLQQGR